MYLKRTCSQALWDALLKEYPGLKDNPGHRRHIARLLWAPDHSKVNIGRFQIARDYDKLRDLANNTFIAIDCIEKFHKEVFEYQYIEHDHILHRCRLAIVEFPPLILYLRDLDLKCPQRNRCFIADGTKFVAKKKHLLKREDIQEADYLTYKTYITPLASKLQQYLNQLPTNRFSKIDKYIPSALDALWDKDPDGNYYVHPDTHFEQRLILDLIAEQPQPIYKPTLRGYTVRLFQLNSGLQGINSYLRGILTQDWIELDMQHAHLSIVATLWDIPELLQLLQTGANMWDLIIEDLNFPGSYVVVKSKLKSIMYSTLYGMSIANLKREVAAAFGEDKVDAFFNQAIISIILKARKDRTDLLTKKKYYTTHLGKEVKPYAYRDEDGFKSNLNSVISYEISEYEMLLLEPIFDLSIETQQFFITLYQYDGITIDVRDKSRKDSILKKIHSVFDKRAKELGIYTKLSIKS